MSKATPGPWNCHVRYKEGGKRAWIVNNSEWELCSPNLVSSFWLPGTPGDKKGEANARLIAAAPALLAACKAVKSECDQLKVSELTLKLYMQLEAAIALAEGEKT